MSSIFAGSCFKVIKNKFSGEHVHIAITTNNIHRAVAYLKMKGVSILPKTAKEKDGKLKAIYLDQEVSRFTIHFYKNDF